MGKTLRSLALALGGGGLILSVAWAASMLPQNAPGKPAETASRPPTLPLHDMASWLKAKFGVGRIEPQRGSEERAKVERGEYV